METNFDINISAIIPTYNRESLIRRALQSVLKQTRPPCEIIVVDDGSTDHTYSQVEPLFGLVDYMYQSNAGASMARYRGVLNAKSDWIAFLDSDDLWEETYLENMARAIRDTSGAAVLYFTDTVQDRDGGSKSLWEKVGFNIETEHELVSDATKWVMMRPQPMMLQSSIISREQYLANAGVNKQLHTREDTHMFLKLGIDGKACAVSGIGTRMTSDALYSERLTSFHDGKNPSGYWMQVLMFEDILKQSRHLRPEIRAEIRHRLAAARNRLARLAWSQKQYFEAVMHAKEGFIKHPAKFLHQIKGTLLDI